MDKANSQVMNKENQIPTQCSKPPESKASRGRRVHLAFLTAIITVETDQIYPITNFLKNQH